MHLSFTAALIPAFLLSQSLTQLQQRLKLVCVFMARLVEPFRQAKKSQPSRSEKRKPSCALWIALMVGETGRAGKKSVFVCVCLCGNLCSSSLDLPCCSGNEGNCSRSSEPGWNYNGPIDISRHSAGMQTQHPGRETARTSADTEGPWLTPLVLLSRVAAEIPIRSLPLSFKEIQESCRSDVVEVNSALAPHFCSVWGSMRVTFPSMVPSMHSGSPVRKQHTLPWTPKHIEVGQRRRVGPYVDPNHQEIVRDSCPSFVVLRPSLVLVSLPGTDVWRSHPVCHPVPASFLLEQEPLISHFAITLGVETSFLGVF